MAFANGLTAYRRGPSIHVRDNHGRHWVVDRGRHAGYFLRRVHRRGHRLHGRFQGGGASWWDTGRGFTHLLMNVMAQQGNWAWYTGGGGTKAENGNVEPGYVPRRHHTEAMNAETRRLHGVALTATDYARLPSNDYLIRGSGLRPSGYPHVASVLPLVSLRGHSDIRYEWCHLVAHGLQGRDHPDNIVAATAYQNSEQLILECVLYEYRQEDIDMSVQAKLAHGYAHLAEAIFYRIDVRRQRAYARQMDARRATRPTIAEFRGVAVEVRTALNSRLEHEHPLDDDAFDIGARDFVSGLRDPERVADDGDDQDDEDAEGLWQRLC